MSYILDALSKSQRERERTTVPTLTTAFPSLASRRNAPKALVAAAVGVLTLGVLFAAYALYVRAPAPHPSSEVAAATVKPLLEAPSATPPKATAQNATAPMATLADERGKPPTPQPLVEASSPVPEAAKPVPAPNTTSLSSAKERGRTTQMSSARQSEIAGNMQDAVADGESREAPTDPRLSPATRWLIKEMAALEQSAQREVASKPETPATQADRTTLASAAADTQPSPVQAAGTEVLDSGVAAGTKPNSRSSDAIPALRDLPPDIRAEIPALEVNVHTYARAPEGRMVFINMKRYGEGDRLSEGPVIDAITPDGVVLVHDQRRFRLPAR